jgi:hypothetical protein
MEAADDEQVWICRARDGDPEAYGVLVQRYLRLVVTLKDLEGYSYEEVSRTLQCKVGAVKSRHARAREKLRLVANLGWLYPIDIPEMEGILGLTLPRHLGLDPGVSIEGGRNRYAACYYQGVKRLVLFSMTVRRDHPHER